MNTKRNQLSSKNCKAHWWIGAVLVLAAAMALTFSFAKIQGIVGMARDLNARGVGQSQSVRVNNTGNSSFHAPQATDSSGAKPLGQIMPEAATPHIEDYVRVHSPHSW